MEDKVIEDTQESSGKTRGAQPGNVNALKHGAYSDNLNPEEDLLYRKKKETFTKQLGEVDIFDDQVVHILSLISAKFDVAIKDEAPPEDLLPLSREILYLLKCLKETRDSRDVLSEGQKTAADFLSEMVFNDEQRGYPVLEECHESRIIELEKEIMTLKKQLDMTSYENISHKSDICPHCRNKGEHSKNIQKDWVCLECGWVY